MPSRRRGAASLRQGYGRQASGVPCLAVAASRRQRSVRCRAHVFNVRSARQAYSVEVAFGFQGRANLRPCWTCFLESTLFPVACYGVTEQSEELEKPWYLKTNSTSSEYPVRLRRGSFIILLVKLVGNPRFSSAIPKSGAHPPSGVLN